MVLVAWILAIAGGGLAFAMSAGSAMGMVRRMDIHSAMAAMPLPTFALYFSAPEAYRAVRAGTPFRELVFPAGPCVIAAVTLLLIMVALMRQERRQRQRSWE